MTNPDDENSELKEIAKSNPGDLKQLLEKVKPKIAKLHASRTEKPQETFKELFGNLDNFAKELGSDLSKGICDSEEKLEIRQNILGINKLTRKKPIGYFEILWAYSKDFIIMILGSISLIILIFQIVILSTKEDKISKEDTVDLIEPIIVLLVVITVLNITTYNDWKQLQDQEKLRKETQSETTINVMRNGGKIISIPTEDIVVGDIIQVNYGDILAADGVCIESMGLRLDESALTGESKELPKSPDGDLILLSPTNVVDGTGRMLAIAVGEKSQNGIICKKLGILEISEEEKNARKEAKKQAKIKQTTQNDNAETNKSDKDGKKEIKESKEPGDDEDFNSTGDNYKSVLQQKQENLSKILTIIAFIVAAITIFVKLTLEILKVKDEFKGNYGSKDYSNSIVEAVLSSLQLALTIVVVAVPEGILIATTLTATIAAKRMKKDGCNVQFISACETMGNATVICSDKTGTLTQNKMTVMQIYIGDKLRKFDEFFESDESSKNKKPQHMSEDYIKLLGRCIALNTNVTTTVVIEELTGDENKPQKKKSKKGVNLDFKEDHLEKNNEDKIIVQRRPRDRYVQNGNKTECALLGLCSDFGIDWKNIRKEGQNRIVKMFAFNSARKCMSTVFEDDDGGLEIFIKGASEVILEKCSTIITEDGSTRSLDNSEKSAIKDKIILPMARNGLRTLSIGVKFASSEERNSVDLENESHLFTNMTLVTLVGIEDPVRPEVPACVSHVNNAGVRVIMVTGDNIETAKSIARQCHIYSVTVDQEHEDPTKNKEIAITSSQFNKMIKDPNTNKFSQQKFDSIWPHLRVLARSQPEDKLTLVSGIINSQVSKHQEIVAVTGDGTNDALAIKKADVGFAMGIAGTDMAKKAADIIIRDDNFASIVKALVWGRNMYDSIAKFLQFQLSVNAVVLIVSLATLKEDLYPLRPIPLLWLNILMDTLASLSLATDWPHKEQLERAPYGRKKSLISALMFRKIIGHTFMQTIIMITLFYTFDKYYRQVLFFTNQENIFVDQSGESQKLFRNSFIFNILVMLTLFNEFNSRAVMGERNVFARIGQNPKFPIIWISSLVIHIVIVTFIGTEIGLISLYNLQLNSSFSPAKEAGIIVWFFILSILIGSTALIWEQILLTIVPNKATQLIAKKIRKVFKKNKDSVVEEKLRESHDRVASVKLIRSPTQNLLRSATLFRGSARLQMASANLDEKSRRELGFVQPNLAHKFEKNNSLNRVSNIKSGG